jgi:hypothetical protein
MTPERLGILILTAFVALMVACDGNDSGLSCPDVCWDYSQQCPEFRNSNYEACQTRCQQLNQRTVDCLLQVNSCRQVIQCVEKYQPDDSASDATSSDSNG